MQSLSIDSSFQELESALSDYSGCPVMPVKPAALTRVDDPAALRAQADAFEAYEQKLAQYREQNAAYRQRKAAIESLWHDKLRAVYADIPDAVFSVLHSEAYDRGHSSGYCEVRNCMINVVSFYERILHAQAMA